MMTIGFGAQLYTVREFAKTPEQIATAFEKVAQIGYKSVQVSGLGEISASALAEIAARTGLKIALTHTPAQKLRGCLKQVMRDHEALGCRIVGLGSMPEEYRTDENGYIDFLRDYGPIASELHANGFTFAYHNHAFEFVRFGERTGMDILLEDSDPECFSLTADVYWIQRGGCDPTGFIRKNGSRISVLHLKDMAATRDNGCEMAEVGSGNLDWKAIIGTARQAGIKWYMVEQDTCKGDPFDALTKSFDYIRSSGLLDGEN